MKKFLCVTIALLLSVAVLFAGCTDDTPKGGVVDQTGDEQIVDVDNNNVNNANNNENNNVNNNLNDNGNNSINNDDAPKSDIEIEEVETVVEQQLGLGAETFLSGNYYLEGVVYSAGEVMPVILATDGENYQFTANYSGVSFGMLLLGDATYVVLPETKQYTPLSERLIAALDIEDSLSVNDFQITKNETVDGDSEVTQFAVTIDGEPGLCTIYDFGDSSIKLYSIGDKLVQVENYEADGSLSMQIVIDEILAQIPSDMLTLKGLEEASVTSFIQSFIGMFAS